MKRFLIIACFILLLIPIIFISIQSKNVSNAHSKIRNPFSFEVNKSLAEKRNKDTLYNAWVKLDAFITEISNTHSIATQNDIKQELEDFCVAIEEFQTSNFYQTVNLQYPEFSASFTDLQNMLQRLKNRLQIEKSFSKPELDNIKIDLATSISLYLHARNNIAEASGNMYANILIAFSALIVIVIIIVLIAQKLIKKSEHELNLATLQEQNTTLFTQAVMQGQEEERNRISLELHDTVAQNIKYAQIQLEQLKPLLPKTDAVQNLAMQISNTDSLCIQDIRTLCYNLTPPDLKQGNLVSAISHFASTFTRDTKILCSVVVIENTPLNLLTDIQKLHCFRLIQEALNNAAKHASPTEASVFLRKTDNNTLLLLITDDGIGISADKILNLKTSANSDHFGIRGMQKRVEFMHGTINFTSIDNEGTEVRIEFPLQNDTTA